jgi:hypothetical protein
MSAAFRELAALRERVQELEHELGQCACSSSTGRVCCFASVTRDIGPGRESAAYKDGHRAGRTDKFIGRRSVIAWITEPHEGYGRDYSRGYRAGWGREA